MSMAGHWLKPSCQGLHSSPRRDESVPKPCHGSRSKFRHIRSHVLPISRPSLFVGARPNVSCPRFARLVPPLFSGRLLFLLMSFIYPPPSFDVHYLPSFP